MMDSVLLPVALDPSQSSTSQLTWAGLGTTPLQSSHSTTPLHSAYCQDVADVAELVGTQGPASAADPDPSDLRLSQLIGKLNETCTLLARRRTTAHGSEGGAGGFVAVANLAVPAPAGVNGFTSALGVSVWGLQRPVLSDHALAANLIAIETGTQSYVSGGLLGSDGGNDGDMVGDVAGGGEEKGGDVGLDLVLLLQSRASLLASALEELRAEQQQQHQERGSSGGHITEVRKESHVHSTPSIRKRR